MCKVLFILNYCMLRNLHKQVDLSTYLDEKETFTEIPILSGFVEIRAIYAKCFVFMQLAEGEIQALKRKLLLLEDELERSESKCATTTATLNEASNRSVPGL